MSKLENNGNENNKNEVDVKSDNKELKVNKRKFLSSIFKTPFGSQFETNLFKPLFDDDK